MRIRIHREPNSFAGFYHGFVRKIAITIKESHKKWVYQNLFFYVCVMCRFGHTVLDEEIFCSLHVSALKICQIQTRITVF